MKKAFYLLMVLSIGLLTFLTSCQRNVKRLDTDVFTNAYTPQVDSVLESMSLYGSYELKVWESSSTPRSYTIFNHPLYRDLCGQKCTKTKSYGKNDMEVTTWECTDTCELFAEAGTYRLSFGYYYIDGKTFLLPCFTLPNTYTGEKKLFQKWNLLTEPGGAPDPVMVEIEGRPEIIPAHKPASGDTGSILLEQDLPSGNHPYP